MIKPKVPINPTCEYCGSKPDKVYFKGDTGEIISIICNHCIRAFEDTIRFMGSHFSGKCDSE